MTDTTPHLRPAPTAGGERLRLWKTIPWAPPHMKIDARADEHILGDHTVALKPGACFSVWISDALYIRGLNSWWSLHVFPEPGDVTTWSVLYQESAERVVWSDLPFPGGYHAIQELEQGTSVYESRCEPWLAMIDRVDAIIRTHLRGSSRVLRPAKF